jgi:hypothetical protein
MNTALRLLLSASLWASMAAQAAPPAVNLNVELRWVETNLPGAAQAGVRDGAVVVGTAGSVSPRGAVVTSTAAAVPAPVQRLTVLNGQRASIQLERSEPLQWLDTTVEIDPSATPASAMRRVYASPRQGEKRLTQGFSVTPTWAGGGGGAAVRVELSGQQDGAQVQSTLLLPLGSWRGVARSGGGAAPAERGTVSSRDAAGTVERELQLRVSVQP